MATPAAEIHIDAALVRNLLREQRADLADLPVKVVAIPRSEASRSECARRSQLASRIRTARVSASGSIMRPATRRCTNAAEARSPEGPPPTPSATAAPHGAVNAASWFTAR